MAIAVGFRYRHKRRGSTYRVIALATLQTERQSDYLPDMTDMVIYQSEADDSVWARKSQEFLDGRFERIEP